MIDEHLVTCPYCWETIALDVDASGGSADYSEDCPVCCHPISVRLRVGHDGSTTVEVDAELR